MSATNGALISRKKRIGLAIVVCVITNFIVAFAILAWRL